MPVVQVDGYYRRNSVTGRREWVDGYTYTRADAPDTGSTTPRTAVKAIPRPPSARALGRARLIQKRQQLLNKIGGNPTTETPGWTEENGRTVMDANAYEAWLSNTIKRAREALVTKGDTVKKFKTEAGGADYTPARKAQHKMVIDAFMHRARKVPREHKVVMTGGRPGAGKTSSLRAQAINQENYFIIDSDAIKEEMIRQGMAPDIEGLTPFESAGLIHEESTDLSDILIERLAMEGINFVVDGTMAMPGWHAQLADELHEMGYKIKGLFVDVTPETAQRRALKRHKEGVEDFLTKGLGYGGRFVDPSIATRTSNNKRNFEALKQYFEDWTEYDNEVDGHLPVLTASSTGGEVRLSVAQEELMNRNQDGIVEDADYYLAMMGGA